MKYKAIDLEINDASQLRVRVGHQKCQWILSNQQGRLIRAETLLTTQRPDWFDQLDDINSMEVTVLCPIFGQTWIPEVLYDVVSLSDFSNFVEGPEAATLQVATVDSIQSKSLYRQDLYPYTLVKMGGSSPKMSSALHNYVQAFAGQGEVGKIWLLDIFDDQFLLVSLEDGKFLRHYMGTFATPDDLLYAILLWGQEMETNPKEIDLYLSGTVGKEDEYWQMLQPVFKAIDWTDGEKYADIFCAEPFANLPQYTALLVPQVYADHRR